MVAERSASALLRADLLVLDGTGFLIPYLLGGWTGVLWGGWVRVFLAHHVTFSVNSICHTFGQAPFETGDRSRNQWLVGLLAFGEGRRFDSLLTPSTRRAV